MSIRTPIFRGQPMERSTSCNKTVAKPKGFYIQNRNEQALGKICKNISFQNRQLQLEKNKTHADILATNSL